MNSSLWKPKLIVYKPNIPSHLNKDTQKIQNRCYVRFRDKLVSTTQMCKSLSYKYKLQDQYFFQQHMVTIGLSILSRLVIVGGRQQNWETFLEILWNTKYRGYWVSKKTYKDDTS